MKNITYRKSYAQRVVRKAILDEIITRPNVCSVCNKTCKPEGHHDNYYEPLKVRWLCVSCHRGHHRRNGIDTSLDVTISTRLEPEIFQKLHELAKDRHHNIAQMMRFLIEREIDTAEQAKDFRDDK